MNHQHHDTIIIGAGLSGLYACHFLLQQEPAADYLILEKTGRPGGAVETFREDGYLAEWGPHGFLNNTPESLQVLEDLGLMATAELAPLGDFVRFLCHRGRLEQLPQSPKQLLTTPLMTLPAKLRILGDLFIPPRTEDQTIGAWAGRRFGRGVLHLIDAAVSGTYAGDYNRLSINSVMPGLRALEQRHGSVLKAMKAKKQLAGSSPAQLPAMVSFPGGMQQLTDTLAAGRNIAYGETVQGVDRENDRWQITTAKGRFSAARLIFALPVNRTLTLCAPLEAPPLAAAPEARIVNVVMGFHRGAAVPRGFGYLAPESEGRFIMGVMFSTHMFPGRSPKGGMLLEALIGGRRHPERLALDDRELIERALADIRTLLPLPERPDFCKVLRPESAIPQQEMDHPRLLDWRDRFGKRFPTAAICGFGWDGIGMNDMAKSARKAVLSLFDERQGSEEKIRPVYF
ncbi:MAG: protoporphyrinogen oxidase [Thermodesulfobacteriota bacterium]